MLYQDDHGGDDVADDNLDSSFLLENTKVACVDVPKVVDAEAVHVVVAQVILVIKDDHHQSKLSHIYMHITFNTQNVLNLVGEEVDLARERCRWSRRSCNLSPPSPKLKHLHFCIVGDFGNIQPRRN